MMMVRLGNTLLDLWGVLKRSYIGLCGFIQTCAEQQPQLVGAIIIVLTIYGIAKHLGA